VSCSSPGCSSTRCGRQAPKPGLRFQRKDTEKLRNFIASKDHGINAASVGNLSPHKSFDVSLYPNETIRKIARDVLYKATVLRFDGSDLMPAKVGAGSFWTEPVKWISGQQDLDTTLNNIDASFPKASS